MIITEQHSTSNFLYKYRYQNGIFGSLNDRPYIFSLSRKIKEIFLPQGYPESVSEDYMEYQIWDTIQAFASSITSTLANQAILKGIGVGDEKATVLGATITWLWKDGAGLVGRIVFAYWKGLFADVLNDISIFIDICSRFLPAPMFPIIVCLSSIGRSLVGVAGSATRAALTMHQARRNNMADVSAKDGSQESLSNLLGLVLNLAVVSLISDSFLMVWITVIVFIFVHLYANYRAVRCICMTTFNQSRFHFLVHYYLEIHRILEVNQVNSMEPVWTGLRRFAIRELKLGNSVTKLSKSMKKQFLVANQIFSNEKYVLLLDVVSDNSLDICILLKSGSEPMDHLKAVFQSELIDYNLSKSVDSRFPHIITMNRLKVNDQKKQDLLVETILKPTLEDCDRHFFEFLELAKLNGWVLDPVLLGADEWRYSGISQSF